MEIRRKVYSAIEDNDGEVRLYSTADVDSCPEDEYVQKAFSDGYEAYCIDACLEKAFSDGYEYAQREFGWKDLLKDIDLDKIAKDGKEVLGKAKNAVRQGANRVAHGVNSAKVAVKEAMGKDLNPKDVKTKATNYKMMAQGKGGQMYDAFGNLLKKKGGASKVEVDSSMWADAAKKGKGASKYWNGEYHPNK